MGDAGGRMRGASAGTSASSSFIHCIEQDTRYSDKTKKLMKEMTFPDCYLRKVDTTKVNLDVIKEWITTRVTEVLGIEDELAVLTVGNYLDVQFPDPKEIQINITGFLGKRAAPFVKEMWDLLLSAQESVGGIPMIFLEKKKEEIKKKKMESEKLRETMRDSDVAASETAPPPRGSERQVESSRDKDRDRERDRDRDRDDRERSRHRDRSRDYRRRSRSRDRDHRRRSRSRSRSRDRDDRRRSDRHERRHRHSRDRSRDRSASREHREHHTAEPKVEADAVPNVAVPSDAPPVSAEVVNPTSEQ